MIANTTAARKASATSYLLSVDRSQPFDPVSFINRNWAVWRGPANGEGFNGPEDQDARSLAIDRMNWSGVEFVTGLEGDETNVHGERKLARLKRSGARLLDLKVGQALWEDYLEQRASSVLEWLRDARGVTNFVLMGTVLRCPAGGRYAICFSYDGRAWDWGGCWLGCPQSADCPTPVLLS